MAVQSSIPIPTSSTVKTTIAAFDEATPVTAWMLVRGALTFHEEYGNYLGKRLVNESGPEGGMTKPANVWLEEVISLFNSDQTTEIHGRLFILGLCELDSELARFLDAYGFRDALKREIQEPYDSLLRRPDDPNIAQTVTIPEQTQTTPDTPPPPPPSPYSDYIAFRSDAATDADQLGRRKIAEFLAKRLHEIWQEGYRAYIHLRTFEQPYPPGGSFIVHLHGPWGAGKTSLLKMVEASIKVLEVVIGDKNRTWAVIWFNGWQNRHLDPVWWPLLDRVYHEIPLQRFPPVPWVEEEIEGNAPNTQPPREIRRWGISPLTQRIRWILDDLDRRTQIFIFKAWEVLWRIQMTDLGHYAVAIVIAFALLIFGLLVGGNTPDDALGSLTGWIGPVSTIIGFFGTIISIVFAVSRTFSSGSAASAQNFVRFAQDPMEKVRVHFSQMVDRVNGPILVIIDDLDRCQPQYVVHLLESIQTLFNDARVHYIIAADRRWLYECFETVYKDFKSAVNEPGRRTGYLFLEKIFQMSVSVPVMSPETQKTYLDFLYRGERKEVEQKMETAAQEAEKEFANLSTTEGLIEQLETPETTPDPIMQQARREAVVGRLASQEVSADIEHFLQPFAPLLERNPRAMKRLINAYSFHLALAVLANLDLINTPERKKQFALWTILSLRWPALAEKLELDPETLPGILKGETEGLSSELATLIREEDVQNVLHGEADGVKVTLDENTLARVLGLQATSSASVVA